MVTPLLKGAQMLDNGKLKFLRYMHGISQVQMAKWCDCSERYIKMVENNEYTPSKEIYDAWLNCCYGIGRPIKREKINGSREKKKTRDADGIV